jgi:hypothetical protein
MAFEALRRDNGRTGSFAVIGMVTGLFLGVAQWLAAR